jgi:hypothetical protein
MLFNHIIPVYSDNCTEPTNTLHVQNAVIEWDLRFSRILLLLLLLLLLLGRWSFSWVLAPCGFIDLCQRFGQTTRRQNQRLIQQLLNVKSCGTQSYHWDLKDWLLYQHKLELTNALIFQLRILTSSHVLGTISVWAYEVRQDGSHRVGRSEENREGTVGLLRGSKNIMW